jgi:uncharacterized membrane protein YgcG
MRQRILLPFVLVTLLGSCTSAYKSGQTPDDVYYSPGREVPAYVETENNNDSRRYEEENFSDHYLRMKSANRNRWSAFDEDFMYWNNSAWNNPYYYNTMRPVYPYGGGSMWSVNLGFYSGFNPYYSSWYNPFCHPGYYGTPVVVVTNPKAYAPRGAGSISSYSPRSYSTDPKTGARTYNISGTRTFSNRTGGGTYYTPASGGSTRSYGTDSYSNPSRSFNNSSNSGGSRSSGGSSSGGSRSSGGSSGGGGGSAPVRSFPRGGG